MTEYHPGTRIPAGVPMPAPVPLPPLIPVPDGLGAFVGDGPVNIAVVIENHALVVVLRPLAHTDQAVRVPVTDHDAEYLTRALAGSLRHLNQGQGCPACTARWADE